MKVNNSFEGQTIYVGLDVHAKSWSVATFSEHSALKRYTLSPPSSKKLHDSLNKLYPKAHFKCCYEAGFSGFWIQRELEGLGISTMLVNAPDIPVSNKDRKRKTDARDASKIARELRSGNLTSIYVPSKIAEKDRSLVRCRSLLVKDQRRIKQRIKMHIHLQGYLYNLVQLNWSKRSIDLLEEFANEQECKDVYLISCIDQLRRLKDIESGVNTKIRELSKADKYRSISYLLQSIPGVSVLGSMIIITELIDIKRFRNLDHLCSFVGLVPDTRSSGEVQRVGGLTYRANKRLRTLLIEASWIAIRHDNSLSIAYSNYCKKMRGQKAIIKIARKLLSRIRYVWLNQQPYMLNRA